MLKDNKWSVSCHDGEQRLWGEKCRVSMRHSQKFATLAKEAY
jgi:hypothetical protein